MTDTGLDLNPDGPHSPEHTAEIAEVFDACSRFLVYATMSRPGQPACRGLDYPSEAYRLLGELYSATGRLPQLCGQLRVFLAAQAATGRVGDEGGLDPAERVGLARDRLGYAAGRLAEVTRALQDAQTAIAGLYVKDSDDG